MEFDLAVLKKWIMLQEKCLIKTIKDLATVRGITEEFKAKDQLAWISAMEQIKHTAEEIGFNDLIYKL